MLSKKQDFILLKKGYVWIHLGSFRSCCFQANSWIRHPTRSVDVYFVYNVCLKIFIIIDSIFRLFLWIIHCALSEHNSKATQPLAASLGTAVIITSIRLIIIRCQFFCNCLFWFFFFFLGYNCRPESNRFFPSASNNNRICYIWLRMNEKKKKKKN